MDILQKIVHTAFVEKNEAFNKGSVADSTYAAADAGNHKFAIACTGAKRTQANKNMAERPK